MGRITGYISPEDTVSYTYDVNNRVVGVTKPDGSVTTTLYDNQQRVTSTVERTATGAVITGFEYTYDDLSRIIEEKVLANSTKMCYTYDNLNRVTKRTIKNLSDDSVVSSETFSYDEAGTSNVIFGYNGRDGVVTEDNGLIYMRARYYSPEMKRFINADIVAGKLSNAVTLNRFAYANGNPVSFVDPFGLEAARGHGTLDSTMKCTPSEPLIWPYYHLHPTALEAAYMAQHIYTVSAVDIGTDAAISYGEWELVDILVDNNGFRMGAYQKIVNGKTLYAVVNKGSTTEDDWIDNFEQPFGLSDDMKQSIELSTEFVKKHKDAHITFVGHSKGGAEAAANAVANNKNAILFNPMTPSLKKYGLNTDEYNAYIFSYVVEGEILNRIFGEVSVGSTKYFPMPKEYEIKWGDSFEEIEYKITKVHDIPLLINLIQ